MTDDVPADAVFRRLLGAETFDALPAPVRTLHLRRGRALWRGDVDVVRGRGLLARLCAWATRLPPSGGGPISVEIVAEGGRERWTRHFDGHAMRSRLHAVDGLLVERLGLVDFRFRLDSVADDIVWVVVGVRLFGLLPLPATWFSQVRAREFAESDRYCFDVVAVLPVAGMLVHYRGGLSGQDA